MPLLHGYLNPIPGMPCFLIPLFVEYPGSNRVLVQLISQNDRIEAFLEMDIEANCQNPAKEIEVSLGRHAFWAFQLASTEILQGTTKDVAVRLTPLLKAGTFRKFPLIQSQVAKFCADTERYRQALGMSYKRLSRHSSISADIWRDATVIAPTARQELNATVQGTLSQKEIDEIRVFSDAGRLKVEVPARILDQVKRIGPHLAMRETTSLARVFGLSGLSIILKNIATPKDERITNEPRAIVRGFSGTGEMIARALHRIRGYEYVIPPWVPLSKLRKFGEPREPLFVFSITNLNAANIGAAIKFTRTFAGPTIKVAVALLPLSFGTLRSEEAVIAQLEVLSAAFDYVFVIGNHLLQRPQGAAPSLTASSKAIKYVRACANSLMEIAWADHGLNSAKDFLKVFPRGYCLVGRAQASRNDAKQLNLLHEAIGSMLNERLSLKEAKRVVLAGAPSIIKSKEVAAFIGQAVENTRNEVLTIESVDSRQSITVLAFGIDRNEITEAHFKSFCLSLLVFLGWRILDKNEKWPIAKATFPGTGEIYFGFLSRDGSLDEILRAFRRTSKSRHVILTNFKPSAAIRSECFSQRAWVFHYSGLDEFANFITSKGKDLPFDL
jgi:hypothetical protein